MACAFFSSTAFGDNMYTILLFIALGCASYFIIPRREYEETGTGDGPMLRGFSWFRLCVLAWLGGLIGWCFSAAVVAPFVPRVEFRSEPTALVTTGGLVNTNVAVVWASGTFGFSMRYNFYVRNGNGSISPESIDAGPNVQLLEDPELKDGGTWVTVFRDVDRNSPLINWASGLDDRREILGQELRVPVGTLITGIRLQ
ncbi:MAG: hypothetical protein JST01_26725 [Cyanobacteria bacterium SZAS TMP-1]|nr:hypothetical protein [Cyanobacteria bacterium SZAS TMP-1]